MDINRQPSAIIELLAQHFGTRILQRPEDYLLKFGSVGGALLHSTLFVPGLVRIDGSILLRLWVNSDEAITRFRNFRTSSGLSLSEVEARYNWVEVPYLFGGNISDLSDDGYDLLAVILRDAWDGYLRVISQGNVFKVEILLPDETGSTIGVGFYREQVEALRSTNQLQAIPEDRAQALKIAMSRHFPGADNFDIDDYAHALGSGVLTLAYSFLFLPSTKKYDNDIVLDYKFSKNSSSYFFNNCILISELFPPNIHDTEADCKLLALQIRDSWDGWLRLQYPQRRFFVEVTNPESANVGVQFYESK